MLRHHWRIETSHTRTGDEYGILVRQLFGAEGLDHAAVTSVVVSSVVPPMSEYDFSRPSR